MPVAKAYHVRKVQAADTVVEKRRWVPLRGAQVEVSRGASSDPHVQSTACGQLPAARRPPGNAGQGVRPEVRGPACYCPLRQLSHCRGADPWGLVPNTLSPHLAS